MTAQLAAQAQGADNRGIGFCLLSILRRSRATWYRRLAVGSVGFGCVGSAAKRFERVDHRQQLQQVWGVVKAKGADPKFVLAAGNAKGRLVLVLVANSKLHVGHGQGEFGEEARSAGLIHQLIHMRQGLHGPLSKGVEPPEVLAEAPRPARFPREDDGGCVRGAGRG
jgi:hypothetical protein